MLRGTSQALTERHDLAMLDLDGVVYVDGEAVPRAAESISSAREAGMRVAFITNNASRTPRRWPSTCAAWGSGPMPPTS